MKEKVAVITGATSGIGRASALLFARSGAKVTAAGRHADALVELEREITTDGGDVLTVQADVTDTQDAERLIETAAEKFGRIDVLVNAAGIIDNGTIADTTLEQWDTMMDINVRSVFYLMQRALPLLERTRGNVVNVSSVTGLRAFPNVLAYCVSKAAVDQLTRCAALELAAKGVRVNAVNPGVVVTNLHRRGGMSEENYASFLENARNSHPLGRPGEPEEVAELIMYLASEKAAWITGATYPIDGGRGQTCAR